MHVPSTFLASAPEPADSTSASDWRFRLLASSAALNTKHMPAKSWRRAWLKARWMSRLFGRISEPSTADRGVASWIGSLAVTRASLSATPESVAGRTILDIFGPTSLASLKRRSRASVFSRTCRDTFLWGSERSQRTLSEWTLKLRRDCTRRRKLAHRTTASDSSSWPTPGTDDSTSAFPRQSRIETNRKTEYLSRTVLMWPTPTQRDGDSRGPTKPESTRWKRKAAYGAVNAAGMLSDDLNSAAAMWSTPRGSDGEKGGPNQSFGAGGVPLATQAANCLPSLPAPPTSDAGGKSSQPTRRLNPRFVEWLQGWPIGWGDCDWPATGLSRYRRLMRSCLCGLVSSVRTEAA